MIKIKSGLKLLFVIYISLLAGCKTDMGKKMEQNRSVELFDFDWKFHYGDVDNGEKALVDDTNWRQINLPHDFSIEDLPGKDSPFSQDAIDGINSGYLVGGTGWYRKVFQVPIKYKGKKVTIEFEGVYMNADIWINGIHLGNHPYGYTSFYFDITNYLKFNKKNTIAVRVRNNEENSRWYSGSGIYRHVWLTVTNPIHIATWGTFVTTHKISELNATADVKNEISNETDEDKFLAVVAKIIDKNGVEVGSKKTMSEVKANSSFELTQQIEVEKPKLWSCETPNLYSVVTEILEGKKILDKSVSTFGFRTLKFSTAGFFLNGKNILLKGGCMHHGNGPLGSAAYDRAEERRVELIKASGYNAIRCAHNPPSKAFLDACDKLGILVINEAFDMWKVAKRPNDYHLVFNEWWKKDIESLVLRDRNHPSIIMWSIGNEIPERATPDGVETSRKIVEYVRGLDSTRPVTAAVHGLKPDKDPYFATLDVSGYNYAIGGDHYNKSIYDIDHKRVPERIIYCSESYPLEAFGSWMAAKKYSFVIGDFVWTAFDYLGEASIGWRGYPQEGSFYPWNHAFCGDIDICGFKRPQSYYRDVLWNNGKQLSIFVKPPLPSFDINKNKASWSKWGWDDVVDEWNCEGNEGNPIEVNVYCAYKQVELFLNGKSQGKKVTNEQNRWMAKWDVQYEAGELKAVAYNDGDVVQTQYLKTVSSPVQIKLTPDRKEIIANKQDLSYVTVELIDKNGNRSSIADNLVRFEIEGPGEIIAVGSSNPMSVESFQQPKRKAYKGRCLVVIKSTSAPGSITLKATVEGLPTAECQLVSDI